MADASNVHDTTSIATRTRSKCKMTSSTRAETSNNTNDLINRVTILWTQLNDALAYAPHFQNTTRKGVSEECIKQIESKLNLTLPAEIRAAISVHDGRAKINYGMNFRLATTDLLPIAQWRPFEMEMDELPSLLFRCLVDENDKCAAHELRDDARDHLTAYVDGVKKANQSSKGKNKKNDEYDLADNKAFHALPCELLVIGEGMDDYVEQYLLSIRTGRIYLAIHNIPQWSLIGTFADWIKMGIENATNDKHDIQQCHGNVEDD